MSALKRFMRFLREKALSRRFATYAPGSERWLQSAEIHFGGFVTNVRRNRVSPLDPRSKAEIQSGGMTGGDRMLCHNYAKAYSRHLKRFVGLERPLVLVECGILYGTGLAVWSGLFPTATIIGMDIDLSYTQSNLDTLRGRGAFRHGDPILLEFDQFRPDGRELDSVLNGRKIDIAIDDGFHSDEAIQNTLATLSGCLADRFAYFIEDNTTVHASLQQSCGGYSLYPYGELTVIEEGK
jgi:hypothetical protein